MDYRNRRYLLNRLYNRNGGLKKLKEEVPSLKVHPPYNHFNHPEKSTKYRKDYDGSLVNIHKLETIHQMVSCKIEEADKFQETLRYIDHPYNFIYELEKWNCKQ